MLFALLTAAATASAMPAADARPICPAGRLESARGPAPAEPEARARKLVELPPANLELTVLRTEDGCIVPVIVRYGIGAPRPKGR